MDEQSVIAVYPLPRIVAYPGHVLQLHVFEPRYRAMVKECVETGLPLGIALGKAGAKKRKSSLHKVEDFLSSNQENYTSSQVFGAGPVKILKTFPDGRYLIEVRIEHRFEKIETLQHIPFSKVSARKLPEHNESLLEGESAKVAAELIASLEDTIGTEAHFLQEVLAGEGNSGIPPQTLSELLYAILRWVVLDPEENQCLLEMDCPLERTHEFLRLLHEHSRPAAAKEEGLH
jgi:Lon protease-like protein